MPCRISDRQMRQFRLIREAEQQKAQRRESESKERQRLAQLENEWAGFKAGVVQAQREQQRQARFHNAQRIIADLERSINPPPPPAQPSYIPPSNDGTVWLGHSDFNVKLMAQPLRWW